MGNKMPNKADQVIDLTESFRLADHGALSNVVIELDDSLNERNNARVTPDSATQRDNITRRRKTATRRHLDNTHRLATATRRNEDSNHTQRRVPVAKGHTPPAKQVGIEVQEDSYRERSPIRMGDCSICFESLSKNPLASTKCGHVFCLKCLQRSLDRREKFCPTCRRPLKGANAYHPLYLPRG